MSIDSKKIAKDCPLVSIVLPVYNEVGNIRFAVESLVNQTYDSLEIIVIDDGSTDGSTVVIEELATEDHRVRVIRNRRNMGLVESLNIGILKAKGEFIARADADDLNLPERIAIQVDFMSEHPEVDVVGSAAYLADSLDRVYGPSAITSMSKGEKLSRKAYFEPIFFHPSVLVRASFFERYGRYDEQFQRAEDLELWIRGLLNGATYQNVSSPLIVYKTDGYQRSLKSLLNRTKSIFMIAKKYSLHSGYIFGISLLARSLILKSGVIKAKQLQKSEVGEIVNGNVRFHTTNT